MNAQPEFAWGATALLNERKGETVTFGNYQNEIYFQGLSGTVSSLPMTFAELEAKAQAALPPSVWSYFAGGAGDGSTQQANVTAFHDWVWSPECSSGQRIARCPSTSQTSLKDLQPEALWPVKEMLVLQR